MSVRKSDVETELEGFGLIATDSLIGLPVKTGSICTQSKKVFYPFASD